MKKDTMKNKLADSLLELMAEKQINSITIKDITSKINCNRNTFYYYFTDIYDLINWIFEEETSKLINNVDFNNHKEVFNIVFKYIEDNKKIISFIYSSIGRDKLREMLYPYFYEVVTSYYNNLNISIKDDNFKKFIIDFYSAGIANTLLKYINNDYKNKEEIINYILLAIDSSLYIYQKQK